MPDPSYEILPQGGRCLLSYGDDEYKYKDKDKDKDKDKVHRRPNICYIFEKQGVQGYQISLSLLDRTFWPLVNDWSSEPDNPKFQFFVDIEPR